MTQTEGGLITPHFYSKILSKNFAPLWRAVKFLFSFFLFYPLELKVGGYYPPLIVETTQTEGVNNQGVNKLNTSDTLLPT